VRINSPPSPSPRRSLSLSTEDYLAVKSEVGISRQRTIKTAAVLRKRHADYPLATGRQVKRRFDTTNRAYGLLSRWVLIDPKMAPVDSAVFFITDIVLFVHFTCEIQSRPISTLRCIKISGDQGQDILKFSMQLFFDDSYVWQDSVDHKEAPTAVAAASSPAADVVDVEGAYIVFKLGTS